MTGQALVHPATGQLLDLAEATTTELADADLELAEMLARLADFRRALVDEVAARMDRRNKRTVEVEAGDRTYVLETNAPSEDVFPVDRLRDALIALVGAGLIDTELIPDVIVTPKPRPPEPRVAKRELAKLLRNPAVAPALEAVRVEQPKSRTLKITVATSRGRGA